jgi:superfamily II DNA or RNA helicase
MTEQQKQTTLFDLSNQETPPHGGPKNTPTVSDLKIQLRDYQLDCLEALERDFGLREGGNPVVGSSLMQMATGLGKTEVFIELARRNIAAFGRVMVVAHTTELVAQSARKIQERTGLLPAIEQGANFSTEAAGFQSTFVCASRQSLHEARLPRFGGFGLLIIDEAHHASHENQSYRKIIEHLRADNPNMKILGVTATPNRTDKSALGRVFEHCSYEMGIDRAVKEGWLVPPTVNVCQVESLNLRDVKVVAGDLQRSAMAHILEQEGPLHEIADVAVREGADKLKTLVFCVSVNQAEALCNLFNERYGVKAGWVCGDTRRLSKDHRKRTLRAFKSGDITCLVNVAVLTEGWDCPGMVDPDTGEILDPGVEHIVMARPTKSVLVYTQMFGRGTRPLPGVVDFAGSTPELRLEAIANSGKPKIKVTDLVDNSLKHRLVSVTDVLGGVHYPEEVLKRAQKNMMERKTEEDVDKALELAAKQVDRAKQKRDKAKLERAKREKVRADALYQRLKVNPFDAYGKVFTDIRNVEVATEKQMKFLKWKRFKWDGELTKNEATRVIVRIQRGENAHRLSEEMAERLGNKSEPVAKGVPGSYKRIEPVTLEDVNQMFQSGR